MNECSENDKGKREQKNRQLITVGLIQRVCRSKEIELVQSSIGSHEIQLRF